MRRIGRFAKIGLPLLVIIAFVVIGTVQRTRKAHRTGTAQPAGTGSATPREMKIGVKRTTYSTYQEELDENDQLYVRETERRFFTFSYQVHSEKGEVENGRLLFHEEKMNRGLLGDGWTEGSIKVTAWGGEGYEKKVWEVEQEGNSGQIEDPSFYKITKFGCCAVYSTDVYFNLATGKKVYQGNSPLICVVPLNTQGVGNRFATVQGIGGSINLPEQTENPRAIGVLQYGTDQKVLYRVLLTQEGQRELSDGYINCLVEHEGKQMQKEGVLIDNKANRPGRQALSGFSLILKWYPDQELSIPVRNDTLDLANAKVPAGYRIRLLK